MRCTDPIISAERMRNEPSVWLHVPGELELLFPLMCSLGDQVHRHKLTCREASSQGHFYCHLVKSRNASFVIDFILQTAVANEHPFSGIAGSYWVDSPNYNFFWLSQNNLRATIYKDLN